MADINAIAESLVNLTIKEANELLTVLKDEYGIEPAAAAAVVAGPAAADGSAGVLAAAAPEHAPALATVRVDDHGLSPTATLNDIRL